MTRDTRLTLHAALATALTSVALYPLFVSLVWLWATLPSVATVSLACWLGRRLRLPALACSLLGIAALLWYLTVVFANAEATLRVIPDRSAMQRLIALAGVGFGDIGQYTAPVPELTGVIMVTAAGVGLMAAVVDTLAVGMRQAAAAGLPLLAIFSVPVAIRLESVGIVPFLVAATGFLGLLLADGRERLVGWGRPTLPPGPRGTGSPHRSASLPDARPLMAVGRRIGAVAIMIALVFPVLVPDLPARVLPGSGLGALGGTNTIAAPNPMVSLKRDLTLPQDVEVLRYRTDDPTPEYLRIYALDRFDGQEWRMSRLRAGPDDRVEDETLSPPGLGNVATEPTSTEVSINANLRDLNFLPLPFPPIQVDVRGDWRVHRETLMVFSTRDVATGRRYRVTGLEVDASRTRLRNAPPPPAEIRRLYLQVPRLPQQVRDLAQRVTADASTPYGKALALQEWFTSGAFTYSLAPRGTSTSALTDFLTESKIGYCEQFAGSMALLARVLDIPARVAVGYTAGRSAGDGEYVVTTHDTHAWPELYFHGVGWLRFEPTPAGPSGQATASVPGYARQPAAQGPSRDTGATADSDASGDGGDDETQPTDDATGRVDAGDTNLGGGAGTSDDAGGPWALVAGVAGALAAAALLVPATTRRVLRHRRWATAGDDRRRARAAWAELRDDAIDLGVPWRASDSPRAAARRVTERLDLTGRAARALERIAGAEERARYAPTPASGETLAGDSRVAHRAMVAAARRRVRLRAALFPTSALAALAGVARRVGLTWDRLVAARERLVTRLRGRWLRRA